MSVCAARRRSPASSASPACWLRPISLGAEIKSRPPVLLLHGDSDEMLPHQLTERAAEVLRQHGVKTFMHIAQGVGHGIDQTGLSHAARFLLEAFKLPMPQQ
jgi:phospholipase/carboxylesterase